MRETDFGSSQPNKMLEHIHEGMKVYDRNDNEIGKVESVFFGSVSPEDADRGLGPASTSEADEPHTEAPLLFDFAFGGAVSPSGEDDHASEVIRARLIREGYVEVEGAGLFSGDHLVLPDQIQSVGDDRIHLSVAKDDLISKR